MISHEEHDLVYLQYVDGGSTYCQDCGVWVDSDYMEIESENTSPTEQEINLVMEAVRVDTKPISRKKRKCMK